MTLDDDETGLAAERTALAWLRTSLAYAATGAVALRVVPGTGTRALVSGALLLAAVVAAWAGTGVDQRSARRRLRVLVVAVVTVVAATTGVVSAVAGPGTS